MEWVIRLTGRLVGLDTAPLIYFIEDRDPYAGRMRPFFQAVARGEVRVVTSMVTLVEVLVHPLRAGNTELAAEYRDILLGAANFRTMAVSAAVAETAARLRAMHAIRTPDAIQLAAALEAGASAFLTNDSRLPRLPGLEVLVLRDLVGA